MPWQERSRTSSCWRSNQMGLDSLTMHWMQRAQGQGRCMTARRGFCRGNWPLMGQTCCKQSALASTVQLVTTLPARVWTQQTYRLVPNSKGKGLATDTSSQEARAPQEIRELQRCVETSTISEGKATRAKMKSTGNNTGWLKPSQVL